MPIYESVLIARQDISAGQVDDLADSMEKIIVDYGGNIARREYWGLRSLAYRMKKNRKGHYVMFNLEASSDAIQEMERNLRLHEDVLRYMTIRIENMRQEPSPMVHGKGDRDRAERRSREDDEDQEEDGSSDTDENSSEVLTADDVAKGDSMNETDDLDGTDVRNGADASDGTDIPSNEEEETEQRAMDAVMAVVEAGDPFSVDAKVVLSPVPMRRLSIIAMLSFCPDTCQNGGKLFQAE